MKLHTVFVTYNRLELSMRAVESYLSTVDVPHTVVIVDNGSSDGTQEWVAELFLNGTIDGYVNSRNNMYPGWAANRGWEQAPDDATFLHRADNDWAFLPGWTERVAKRFINPRVAQVGLRTNEEEAWNPINVGGNSVIRRELWDSGLRYDERPWPELDAGWSEDAFFSPQIKKMGWQWTRVQESCIVPLEEADWDDPYYQESFGARRITKDML